MKDKREKNPRKQYLTAMNKAGNTYSMRSSVTERVIGRDWGGGVYFVQNAGTGIIDSCYFLKSCYSRLHNKVILYTKGNKNYKKIIHAFYRVSYPHPFPSNIQSFQRNRVKTIIYAR